MLIDFQEAVKDMTRKLNWTKSCFDYICVQKMLSYMSIDELGNCIGSSPLRINGYLKKKFKNCEWEHKWENLSDDEKDKIIGMIELNKLIKTEDDHQIVFRICSRSKPNDYVITIIISHNQAKVIFDMPIYFIKRILAQDYQRRLNCSEQILEKLESQFGREVWRPYLEEVIILGEEYVVLKNNNRRSDFEQRVRDFSSLGYEEYCNQLGLGRYLNQKTYNAYESYRTELSKIAIENNKVFLDSKSDYYHNMSQFANNRKSHINILVNELGYARDYNSDRIIEDEDFYEPEEGYPEGKDAYRVHLTKERRSKVVKEAKKLFFLRHDGKLFCEACKFDFTERYGERGSMFIEGHHTKLVSEMQEGEKTKVGDIAMLCSNCHSMIHRNPLITVEKLAELIKVNLVQRMTTGKMP